MNRPDCSFHLSPLTHHCSSGGEGAILTHGGVSPTPAFSTGAVSHYATSPKQMSDVRDQMSANPEIALNPEVTSSFDIRLRASRPKKLLHDFSALFLKHTGCNLNPVIQEIRIANSKARFDGAGPLVARAIHQPFHARLYQRACTHHTRFNCRINRRVCEAVVINAARCLSERQDFRMGGRILIRPRSVSSNREYRSTGNDAGADGDLTTLSRLICRAERLLHPMRA